MKKKVFLILYLLPICSFSQTNKYFSYIELADSLFKTQEYLKSSLTYTEAFKSNNWLGLVKDRYHAACSWSLTNNLDSAFSNLNKIVMRASYSDEERLVNDKSFFNLHNDIRWRQLVEIVKKNRENKKDYNYFLSSQLDSIYSTDQKYRIKIEEIEEKHGFLSEQMNSLRQMMSLQDSINLEKVTSILNRYGWLGSDVIGERGSTTLFLVIQHSDQPTQERYLPMVREAVRLGKLRASSLALLEDRVAIGQGRKQVYGSQILKDSRGNWIVAPIDDEINVNERRKTVGLEPLEKYLKHWGIEYVLPK